MLVSQACKEFVEDYIWLHGFTVKTAQNYQWSTNSFIKAVGDIPITEISQAHIKSWRRFMESHQYEVGAVNAFLYRLRKLLCYYEKKLDLSIEPSEIIIPKKNKPIPKYLSIEEVTSLINSADIRGKAMISILYASGIRVGELCKLRRKDIYGDTIKVRGKGNRERIAFLDKTALRYLDMYLSRRIDTNPFVFPSRKGGGIKTQMVQQIVKEAGFKAGIPKIVTPHVLRHSFATHMVQNGCGAFHLQKMLGHADISTTQIYVHLGSKDLRTAYTQFHKA